MQRDPTERDRQPRALSATIVLRQRSAIDVFDLALRFLVVHRKNYAWLSAVVLVPCFLLTLLASRSGFALAWPLAIGVSLFAQEPFTLLASRLVFHEHVPAREVIRDSLRAFPTVVGVRMAQSVFVAIGFCVFGIGSIWAGSMLLFATETALLERSGVGASLSRANRIASASSGDALVTFLLLLFLQMAFVLLAEFAGRAFLEDLLQIEGPAHLFDVGGNWLTLLGFWLFIPFQATARFLAYINFRTSAEGWDVQTTFFALSSRPKNRDRDGLLGTKAGRSAA